MAQFIVDHFLTCQVTLISKTIRDRSLIMGRGVQNGGGGTSEVLPIKKSFHPLKQKKGGGGAKSITLS